MRVEHWIYSLPLRLRSLFHRRQVEEELDEELQDHLHQKIEEGIARGLSPDEARYSALRAMDGLEQRKQQCRDLRGVNAIENFVQDLRHGLRMLRKSPGFTTAAVLTLALGIGANTAVFSVVNAVLLRPLRYPEPDRMVNFYISNPRLESISIPVFMVWRQQTGVLEDFAIYGSAYKDPGVSLTNTDHPETLRASHVSAGFFKLFGASIEAGRTFSDQEDVPHGPKVAVISDGFWRRRFGADRSLVGNTISLGGESYVVVGVVHDMEPTHSAFNLMLGPSLRIDTPADVWLPLQADPNSTFQSLDYRGAARLKPGVTLEMAQAATNLAQTQFHKKFPELPLIPGFEWGLESMSDAMVGNVRLAILVLMGAVSFVMLIACANVANLLLARAAHRRREMAIRAALGARRRRIVFQLLTETLPLSLAGGALGIVLGYPFLRILLAKSLVDLPRIGGQGSAVTLDWRVLLFTILATLLTSVIFGLIPALSVSRCSPHAGLMENDPRSSSGLGRKRTRSILVVLEMALSLILLAGAALLMRTFVALKGVNPGFETRNILTCEMSLNQPRFDQTSAVARLVRDGQRRVEALPGVEMLAATRELPLDQARDLGGILIEGRPKNTNQPAVDFREISARYFDVFRIPLLQGRTFTEQDTEQTPRVAVINETMAKKFWPGYPVAGSPIGERISMDLSGLMGPAESPLQIVGVVGDARDVALGSAPEPMMYILMNQCSDWFNAWDNRLLGPLIWVIRTKAEPLSLNEAIQHELRIASGGLAVGHVRAMDQVRTEATADSTFNMTLFNVFAGIAILLAAIGIFGVMACFVNERTKEIGLRIALGALPRDVLAMVVRQGMRLVVIGISIGIMGSLALTPLIASLLYGVKSTDPTVLACVAALLCAVALATVYFPARRATKIDPVLALRWE
ncbi:MAG: ABC transporter permease [Silvibacterium sp.]|nr:ABC transporter permease [Silvibacterium sp.]